MTSAAGIVIFIPIALLGVSVGTFCGCHRRFLGFSVRWKPVMIIKMMILLGLDEPPWLLDPMETGITGTR
jgi:hypothetical protein